MAPKITCLLCTVREDAAFSEHPEWKLFEQIKDTFEKQTYKDFELIVVDGLKEYREFPSCNFPVKHLRPLENIWTKNKKISISTYRNTGIVYADGEYIVNFDDTFTAPDRWIELYAKLFDIGVCGAATWRRNGCTRLLPGQSLRAANRGEVYGFGSYPVSTALELNGYDLAFDGSMYLEDIEWGMRLHDAGIKQKLFWLDGFRLEAQSKHASRVVDEKEPIVKCCNPPYQMAKVVRNQSVANITELWRPEDIQRLLAPCAWLTPDGKCKHHGCANTCAYLTANKYTSQGAAYSFANKTHPLAEKLFEEPPVVDLKQLRKMRKAGEL